MNQTTTFRPRQVIAAAATIATLALAGCSPSSDEASSSSTPAETTTLTVFAAASLTDTFTEIGDQFSAEHDGVDVKLNFAGSADLVSQLTEGAQADVLATADEKNMTKAQDAGLVTAEPQIFVKNTLAIVTPPDNPAGITSYEDLTKDGLKLVICAEQVPCGSATQTLAEQAGLDLTPVSEENAVTDVLAKVTSGEADAGVVYITDATGAGDEVNTITIPDDVNVINQYPVAPLASSANPELAQEFADSLITGAGKDVLAEAGFVLP